MSSRAIRRHHYRRLLDRWRSRVSRWVWPPSGVPSGAASLDGADGYFDAERMARLRVATPKPCSCSICGNPRKDGEPTMQERRATFDEVYYGGLLEYLMVHGHEWGDGPATAIGPHDIAPGARAATTR